MERQTMRRVTLLCAWMFFAAACSSALLPTAGPSSSATHSAPAVSSTSPTPVVFTRGKVEMGDNFFAPEEISVVVGATVTWQINQGENNHDVASIDGLFHSNVPMTRGVDMFMYTFTKPGEYSYVCSFHVPEGMTGKIIVK
jgi:plastocyanin